MTQCLEVASPDEVGPLFAAGRDDRWFVLHTKSRQEKVVAEEAHHSGAECFLPLRRTVRLYGHRRDVVDLPLFPGYVFLRGSIEDAYEVGRTRRLANILPVTDQARLNWELRNLALALHRGAQLDPFPALRQGVRVRVSSGPFLGLEGVVEGRGKFDRVILLVQMLGQGVSVELSGAAVDVID